MGDEGKDAQPHPESLVYIQPERKVNHKVNCFSTIL